jgi:hypothetical protein
MKSPFPGMDPYIEAHGLWGDFHYDLISEIKRALAVVLPERYFVRIGERSYIVLAYEKGKADHLPIPDVVAEAQSSADPVEMLAFVVERFRENFIEIFETSEGERLVTCIEVLSPSNKRPNTEGWDLYLRKRQALLLGAANFVEIDLLRGGRRMPMLTPWPSSPCYLLICRRRRAPYCTAWPAGFRERLPVIPVPLDDPDPDVMLDLQPMIEAVYVRSRYARSINYSKALTPPLAAEDTEWLARQLAARETKERNN